MKTFLRELAYKTLLDLSHEEGINASGKDEIFGCIFGRDSALTILKILRVHSKAPSLELLEAARRGLVTLASLSGREFNLESGEEPGKFVHEFRRDNYQRLLEFEEKPWYVYPDGIFRNYDSIDSTPLGLIAMYRYYEITQDREFLVSVLPSVEAGLNWIITFGDRDKDFLIEYDFSSDRVHGGLQVQSWTDSTASIMDKYQNMPKYPIAPVEVQGHAWLALKLWAKYYADHSPTFSKKLDSFAKEMKKAFNKSFVYQNKNKFFTAQALDGDKNQIRTVTGNSLLLLWSVFQENGKKESILDEEYILDLVSRSFERDLFDKEGGIRTMSTSSLTFNPNQDSYHNGSFWPILNGLIHEGLEEWGFTDKATELRDASLRALYFFESPIELYVKDSEGNYLEYKSSSGQVSCRQQAWSAAAVLDLLS